MRGPLAVPLYLIGKAIEILFQLAGKLRIENRIAAAVVGLRGNRRLEPDDFAFLLATTYLAAVSAEPSRLDVIALSAVRAKDVLPARDGRLPPWNALRLAASGSTRRRIRASRGFQFSTGWRTCVGWAKRSVPTNPVDVGRRVPRLAHPTLADSLSARTYYAAVSTGFGS
jgi:hypothetical protein